MGTTDELTARYLESGRPMGTDIDRQLDTAIRRHYGVSPKPSNPSIKPPESPKVELKKALRPSMPPNSTTARRMVPVQPKPNASAEPKQLHKQPAKHQGSKSGKSILVDLSKVRVQTPAQLSAERKLAVEQLQVPSEKKMMSAIDLLEQCAAGDQAALKKRKEILARSK